MPHAIQVADRWHLMENATAAFHDAVRLSMRAVRSVLGATTIDPALLTAAERLQHEGFLRRKDTTRQILPLKTAEHSIKGITRRTRHSRRLVRQAVRGMPRDVFRIRQSSLEAYLPVLLADWYAGCRNGAELWRRLQGHGFKGSSRVVAVEAAVPSLAAARSLVDRFGIMIRTKTATELDSWIEQARASLVAPLARGVAKDKAAARAAMTEPWSNGQTEGQINRLKLIKRQMYGRAKLDLLEARLIGAV